MSWQAIRLAPRVRIGDDPIAMSSPCDILCVGAAHWDRIGRSPWRIAPGGDVPGTVTRSPGGVALNIALGVAVEGMRPALLASVGTDAQGAELIAAAVAAGIDCTHVHRMPGRSTDLYLAIEGPQGLVAAVADSGTLEAGASAMTAPFARGGALTAWAGPLVLDGNLPVSVLARLIQHPGLSASPLCLVPASPAKAARLRGLLGHPRLTIHGNVIEAAALTGKDVTDAESGAQALRALGFARAVVTDGAGMAADAGRAHFVTRKPPKVAVRRVTGAGDRFIAAHIVATIRGASPEEALAIALERSADFVGRAT
jgi:pseudouridine kinase